MIRLYKILEQNPYIISLIIITGLIYWFGESARDRDNAEQTKNAQQEYSQEKIPEVVATKKSSTIITNSVNSYGTSKPLEKASLRTKVSGEIIEVFKEKGDEVQENENIIKIDSEPMEARLEALKQTRQEIELKLKISKELYDEDFSSKVEVAETYSAYKNINAEIKELENAIENSTVKAPISGTIDDFDLNRGDFVASGEVIGTINDLSKLVMSADIPESHQDFLEVGKDAYIEISENDIINGQITYVASVADPLSHTFNIEVTANERHHRNVGTSASVFVLTDRIAAYNISPALLSLNPDDKEKRMGVKIVNEQNKVEFLPVDIIKSSQDGLWINADKQEINLITSGHAYVNEGQEVSATYDSFERNSEEDDI